MNSVPQKKYDEKYYKENCDGYTESGCMGPRLQFLFDTIITHVPKETTFNIMDIGCGRGELTKKFADLGHSVLAVDYSYAVINIFETNVGDIVPFLRHDISNGLPWIKDQFFDFVILADILEHIYHENMAKAGREIMRITKDGGFIFIDTPIMYSGGGSSELHVNVKKDVEDVNRYFRGTQMLEWKWYRRKEHCNIVLKK
jgi:2-polyprenyl-3-methyl-5-hydroxy-6-metoxy-1,4-benzoquinol methylase